MSSLKSISISKLTFIIPFLLGVSFIYSIIFGIIISSHSESYIQGYEIRTAGYPMIINVFSKIFKENGLLCLVFLQIFLWLFSSLFFVKEISRVFNLSKYVTIVLWMMMCFPLNPPEKFGNSILTQSFTFIGIIWFFLFLFRTFEKNNLKDYLILTLVLVCIQLLNPQMQFLSIFLIIISFPFFFIKKRKQGFFYIICGILGFFIASNIDKTYHYFKHDRFGTIPFTGIKIINLPLFTISKENIEKIKNPSLKIDILTMKEKLILNDPYYNQEIFEASRPINNFATSYNTIISKVIYPTIKNKYPEYTYNEIDKKLIKLAKEVVFVCLQNQPFSLLSAYIDNIVYLGFAGWMWILLTFFIFLLSLYYFIKFKTKRLFILLSMCIAHFCNILFVSVREPIFWKYSFYTELPLTAIIITLVIFSFLNCFKRNV